MAEQVLVVCDVCGKPAADTVAITAGDKPYRKDLCSEHLAELLRGARTPKRGRPSGRRSAAQAAPAQAPRRRGGSRKARTGPSATTSTEVQGTKRPRRRITDPIVLEKRRAALAKARAARAAKRAAAQASAG
jgi:hypothetical protein